MIDCKSNDSQVCKIYKTLDKYFSEQSAQLDNNDCNITDICELLQSIKLN